MNKARKGIVTFLASQGATLYTISGTVYDADGSTAVEGATVALGALSAVSAANGTFTISSVPPGTSGSMTCTLAGYSWDAISISAMSGNLTGQDYTAEPYLYDTMTDVDDTLLTAHAPDINLAGNAWGSTINIFNSPSALKIVGAQATKAPEATSKIGGSVIDVEVADLIYELDITTDNTVAGAGVLFRYVDTSNYWYLFVQPSGTPSVTLRKVAAGTPTAVDTDTPTIAINAQYHVKITLSGNSISCEIAGVTLTASDSHNAAATSHGIAIINPASNGTPSKADNLWMARVANPT